MLGISACAKTYGYEPTGDKLLDRFALLVVRQLADESRFKRSPDSLSPPPGFDFSALGSWEKDFGDEPRYWQLRWLFDQDLMDSPDQQLMASELTINAIKAGCVDEASYAAIDFRAVDRDDPARAMALVEQAIERMPENSYFYYVQAYLFERKGETGKALKALRRGNLAPHNDPPHLYPLYLLDEHPEYFSAEANKAVRGVILGQQSVLVTSKRWLPAKQLVQDVMKEYRKPLPLDVADELLTAARKYGQQSDYSVIRELLGLTLLKIIIRRLQEDYSELSIVLKVNQLDGRADDLHGAISNFVDAQPSAEGGDAVYEGYVNWWDDFLEERRFVEEQCLPILDEIGKIKLAEQVRNRE